jgi:hypothetical protein
VVSGDREREFVDEMPGDGSGDRETVRLVEDGGNESNGARPCGKEAIEMGGTNGSEFVEQQCPLDDGCER